MGVNSLPKTVTRQRRGCDLNPGPSVPESSTLTTQLPSHSNDMHCGLLQAKERQCKVRGTNAAESTAQAAAATTAVQLGREKVLRHQCANQLDAFTTLAELMALGSRDNTASARSFTTYNPLLSVTTV